MDDSTAIYESVREGKVLLIEPRSGHWWIGPCQQRLAGKELVSQWASENEEPDVTYPELILAIKNRDCNLKCTYCFADADHTRTYLSVDDLLTIFDRTLGSFPEKRINFLFTGGEPLLHFPVIQEAVSRFRASGRDRDGRNPKFSIMTNGTLFNKTVIDFLQTQSIQISVSFDGPRDIHDRNRSFGNNTGSFDLVMRGLDLLRGYGIAFGVVTTIVSPGDVGRCYDFFLDQGIHNLFLRPLRLQGREMSRWQQGEACLDERVLYEEAMAHEFLTLADRIARHNQGSPVKVFESTIGFRLLHLIYRRNFYMCLRGPCGAGSGTKLGVDWNGVFYPCDTMVEFQELGMFGLADIRERESFKELLEKSPVLARVRNRAARTIQACRRCPVQRFCGGGCSAASYEVHRNLESPGDRCVFERKLFEGLLWKIADDAQIVNHLLNASDSPKTAQLAT